MLFMEIIDKYNGKTLPLLPRFPVKPVQESQVKIEPFRRREAKIKHLTIRKHFKQRTRRTLVGRKTG